MNLRRKTLLSMTVLMAVMTVLLVLISYNFVIGAALDHERTDVETDVERAFSSIQAMEGDLATTTADWAVWNDTYTFMGTRDQAYVDSNLGYDTCDSLDLNCFLLFNNSCKLVYGMAYDCEQDMPWVVSDELTDLIIDNVRCLDIDQPEDSAQGLIRTGRGIMLISVHPVTNNDLTMTNGFLVLGRYIDDRATGEISRTIQLDTAVLSPDPVAPAEVEQASWNSMMDNGSTAFRPADSSTIFGYRALSGLNGSAVGVVMVRSDRDILAQANASMYLMHGMLVLTSAVFCSAAIVITDRFTTRRLDRLSRQVYDLGRDGDTARRIEMDGSDELTRLADELNRAMSTIRTMGQALSESERRYHAVVNDQTEIILRMDGNGRIVFANDALIELHRLDPAKVGTLNLRDLTTKEEFDRFMEKCRTASASGSAVTADRPYRKGDEARDRWMAWTMRCVLSGGEVNYQCVGRDITEQKEAEAALALANKKLNMLASITRHDVINKLTVAHGYVTITRRNVSDPRCADHLSRAEDALGSIEGYLEFTKNYQSMGLVAPVWIDLEAAMTKAAAGPRAEGLEVRVKVGDHEILTDPLVEKVFCNLLDNAVRHGGKVRSIEVSARPVDGRLLVTFEDDGVGVPGREKELIFEAGYGKHTGYGLFLAREILGVSGMTIVEIGREGEGARFEIMVPAGRFRHRPQVT